jgi:hypothetical protein
MLRDAANHAQRDDLEILDLAEIVAKSLRPKPHDEASCFQTHLEANKLL